MPTLTWSPEAEARFERWLAARLTFKALDGADPDEVAGDWRLHVEEELARRGETPADTRALDRVLAALDRPVSTLHPEVPESAPAAGAAAGAAVAPAVPAAAGAVPVSREVPPSPSSPSREMPPTSPPFPRQTQTHASRDEAHFRWPKVFLFFAVILPLVTVAAEALFGLCAGTFFDPLPSPGHAIAVALVPLSLWFLYAAVKREDGRWQALARPGAGFALTMAAYYAVAFGNLLPVALIGLFVGVLALPFWPLTWMTLSPFFVVIAGVMGLRRLSRAQASLGKKPRGLWLGVVLGVAALMALEGPRWWTYLALEDAVSDDPEVSEPAIRSLRRWGSSDMVHRACFESQITSLHNSDPASWILSGNSLGFDRPTRRSDISPEKARLVFYRMTGRAFNEVKPRRSRVPLDLLGTGRADRARATQWVWDGERGGDTVGARLPGLALAVSRLEWHVEEGPRLAYGEWTMEFSNAHPNDQEARGQVLLPPGACVSRLTLWVNGEPQEAAFAANAQVKAAYREVVTVERRDPVLVTQVGPDRVLVQCFPVPPDGGRIKIRLGMTAPLDDAGRLWQPSFLERNFSMSEGLRHALWVQSRAAFDPPAGIPGSLEKGENGNATWQAELTHAALAQANLRWSAPVPAGILWCEDALAAEGEGRFVTAQWTRESHAAISRLFVVIDGSAGLLGHRDAVVRALAGLPAGTRTRVWLTADDGARELPLANLERELTEGHFLGGQNATPGLKAALAAARETTDPAALVWLHGPQPAELPGADALEQALMFSLRRVPIYAVAVEAGPHRLLEKMYRAASLRSDGRLDGDPASLAACLHRLAAGGERDRLRIARVGEPPGDGVKVSDQLARHAAFAETLAAFHAGAPDPHAIAAKAARHQVVTPYSGAVVLERQDQYTRHGLQQVDVSSVPTVPVIPEPGVLWMVAAGLALALRRRRAA